MQVFYSWLQIYKVIPEHPNMYDKKKDWASGCWLNPCRELWMTSGLLYDYSPDAPPLVLPEPDVLVCERVIEVWPVFSAFIRDLMFLRLGTEEGWTIVSIAKSCLFNPVLYYLYLFIFLLTHAKLYKKIEQSKYIIEKILLYKSIDEYILARWWVYTRRAMSIYSQGDEYILVRQWVYTRKAMSIYSQGDEYILAGRWVYTRKAMSIYSQGNEYILVRQNWHDIHDIFIDTQWV